MIGREAYQNPYMLGEVDSLFELTDAPPRPQRVDIATRYAKYIETQLNHGVRLNHMTRHILGLFNGQPGARKWRRYLSEHAYKPDAGIDTYFRALETLA